MIFEILYSLDLNTNGYEPGHVTEMVELVTMVD